MGLCTKPMAMIAMPTSKALSNPIKSQSSHTNRLKGERFYQELGNASSFNQSLGNPSIAVLPIILQTELTLAVSPSLFTGLHQTYKNKSCICSVCEVHLKIPNEKSPKICCGPPHPKKPFHTVPLCFGLAVHRDDVRAGLGEVLNALLRLHDHQMAIEHRIGVSLPDQLTLWLCQNSY